MSTQTTLNYRTNRDLFSNYYLDEHLPETEAWDQVDDDELRAAYDEIKQLWEHEKDTAPKRNESQLEEKFIRPMFRKLGIPFEVEESTEGTQRRPDYGFFRTEEDGVDAFQRREEGGDFYKNAIAVADAKRWGQKLDTREKKKRDYENPSHQIDQYLRFTSTTWGVLTNGQKWRLYYKPTSHRLDSYYEIDLPTVLEQGDLEDFKYFYLFFRHDAFVPDTSGDAFLDDVYEKSNVFAQELGEDLQDNIYEAIKHLAEGYLQYPENDLGEDDLELIHDSSLIYLYRIIFVLYAEAEGRDLLDTNDEIYESQYSLNQLKQEVADELESGDPKYRDWQSNLQSRLDELFMLIDQGSKSRGIPEEDLNIPAYNGGLFRTDPDESGSDEALFLANHTVGDEHLARVIELLTRSESSNGVGKIFVDYSSLDVRQLGSIYEGLLEYQLEVADKPLAVDDGEYVVADESSEVVVERDKVYLTTDSGERKATGSYYTPEYIVEYIVEETLRGPVDEIRKDVVMDERFQNGGYAEEFAERVFDLKILDPAMGSGHFLTSVVDYLARAIITEQNREAEDKDGDVIDHEHDINWARRKVAQRCIYGVDSNPLATELAKVSLWLRTLAAEQPLAFLDHHLKTGDSLVGSDIQNVLVDESDSENNGQLTLEQSFAHTRKKALDHVMDRFQELLAIDNETLEDAKEMENVYSSVRNDPLYQKLLAMANVHTAEQFGINVPSDADKRMAEALRSDSWDEIEGQDWFRSAQARAEDKRFFHWELEFPIAFYEMDGNPANKPGFDAVIGNPPYVISFDKEMKEFLSDRYPSFVRNNDLYTAFMQRAIGLCRLNGKFSFITPNTYLTGDYFDDLKQYILDNSSVESILDFGTYKVFPEADVYCSILLTERMNGESITQKPNYILKESKFEDSEELNKESTKVDIGVNDDWGTQKHPVALKCESVSDHTIADVAHVKDIGFNYWTEGRGKVRGGDSIGKRVLYDGKAESEDDIPYLKGSDFHRFEYPKTEKHWLRHDWESRLNPDIDTFRFSPEYLRVDKKILYRQTADEIIATLDSDGNLVDKTVHIVLLKDNAPAWLTHDTLLCLLNSRLYNFIYREITDEEGRGFAQVKRYRVQELPLPPMGNLKSATSQLNKISEDLFELKGKLGQYNADISDYFSPDTNGKKLIDISQPAKNSVNSLLNKRKKEYPDMRTGSVKLESKNEKVTLKLTARYKPENEEDHDTNRWGYTETDYIPALEFVGLTDEERVLIEDFVPVAINEGSGFADFRGNVTQKKSILDRLGELTLPDLSSNKGKMNQYMRNRRNVTKIKEQIQSTSDDMNDIVYGLYGLDTDEIEFVENTVE